MKIKVNKEILLKVLNNVVPISEAKTSCTILSSVMVCSTIQGKLSISSTDLSVFVTCDFDADIKIDEYNGFTVIAKQFRDIVRSINDEVIVLNHSGSILNISGGKSKFKLNTLLGSDFPESPLVTVDSDIKYFNIDSDVFTSMFSVVSHATSTNIAGDYRSCIYVKKLKNELSVVALDGNRMAMDSTDIEYPDFDFKILIPSKSVFSLNKLISGIAEMGITDSSVFFKWSKDNIDSVFVSNLVEENFPPYKDVLPIDSYNYITLPRCEFIESIKRVGLVSNEFGVIKMSFFDNSLIMSGLSSNGESLEDFDIKYNGNRVDILINIKYILSCLLSLGSNEVSIGILDSMDPFVVKIDSFVGVIMPMSTL